MTYRKAGRVVAAALVAIALVPVLSAQESRVSNPTAVVPVGALHQGPADAKATIVIFSDFQCPVCARTPPVIKELLKIYPDQIRLVFKHNPLAIHPDAPLAHEAALVAATQGKFWEMHDILFANQRLLKEANLRLYAQQAGLDMAAFDAALADRRFKPLVDEALIDARGLGITSTPTFFINGRRVNGLPSVSVLRSHVDAALGLAPATTTLTSIELKPGDISVDDAPTLGRDDAPVTLVEFSDLQCPFCARTVATVQEMLKAYPREVKWVFKHFPLDIHDDAPLAHRAALAAKAQGKFWEFHDAVFATQRAMKREDLIAKADALGLDIKRFTAELDKPEYKAKVEADKAEGKRLGVGGTPTFFINGRRLSGAKSAAEFKAVIEAALKDRTWSSTGTRGAAARAADEDPSAPVMRRGRTDAPIELEWYSDLRSPLTPKAAELVSALLQKHPTRVRVTLRHRPVPDLRPDSRLAHEGAMAAAAQGKFWEMHDRILATRETLTRAALGELAGQVGLNRDKFLADLDAGTYKAAIDRDLAEAQSREIRGTPVFFVDGQRVDGLQSIATFEKLFPAEPARAEAKP
jgi:protein-disulfide isomerase